MQWPSCDKNDFRLFSSWPQVDFCKTHTRFFGCYLVKAFLRSTFLNLLTTNLMRKGCIKTGLKLGLKVCVVSFWKSSSHDSEVIESNCEPLSAQKFAENLLHKDCRKTVILFFVVLNAERIAHFWFQTEFSECIQKHKQLCKQYMYGIAQLSPEGNYLRLHACAHCPRPAGQKVAHMGRSPAPAH